jgi:hypothetical protein
LWTVIHRIAPDAVYRTQKKWFRHSQETFNAVMYSFLGLFKIFFLFFNLVPFIALLVIGQIQTNGNISAFSL